MKKILSCPLEGRKAVFNVTLRLVASKTHGKLSFKLLEAHYMKPTKLKMMALLWPVMGAGFLSCPPTCPTLLMRLVFAQPVSMFKVRVSRKLLLLLLNRIFNLIKDHQGHDRFLQYKQPVVHVDIPVSNVYVKKIELIIMSFRRPRGPIKVRESVFSFPCHTMISRAKDSGESSPSTFA